MDGKISSNLFNSIHTKRRQNVGSATPTREHVSIGLNLLNNTEVNTMLLNNLFFSVSVLCWFKKRRIPY